MKKESVLLLIFAFAILILPAVLAIETTLKQEYQPGETLIAEISGNFIDSLEPENFLFYSGRAFIPMIYDVSKIQDKYYVYALLPDNERNYALIIKDAHYLEEGMEKSEDLQFNFSVSGNISLFSVNPGFIITNKDFNIKLESKVKSIVLKSEFLNSTKELSISAGQEKTLSFSVADIKEFTITNLALSAESQTYIIPVAVFKSGGEKENLTLAKEFRLSKSLIDVTILKGQEFPIELIISNTGQEDIEDVSIESNIKELTVKPEEIDILEAGKSEELSLTIKSGKIGEINGTLKASSANYTFEIPVFITITENKTEFLSAINTSSLIIQTGDCDALNGKICADEEECTGEKKLVLEGICCIGTCQKKKTGASNWIWIIVIIIILAGAGFFIYRRIKFRRKTTKEIFESKSKSYEERFKPKEVRGSLTRV